MNIPTSNHEIIWIFSKSIRPALPLAPPPNLTYPWYLVSTNWLERGVPHNICFHSVQWLWGCWWSTKEMINKRNACACNVGCFSGTSLSPALFPICWDFLEFSTFCEVWTVKLPISCNGSPCFPRWNRYFYPMESLIIS